MKKILFILLVSFSFLLQAQEISTTDSTGLPGDNLDLAAVLNLFKESKSPEDFESKLNSADNTINNLDLNGDGKSDYIGIFEYNEENANALVLRVNVNEKESQDIAVIAIEKTGTENARLQIIGDEEIYGSSHVAEPYDEKSELKGSGPYGIFETKVVIVNVWAWPAVRFIYGPIWKPWRSPYYWGYYPPYWKPWKPLGWRSYRKRVYGYGPMVVFGPTIYLKKAHKVYTPHKVFSPIVKVKYAPAHAWHKAHYKAKPYNGKSGSTSPQSGKTKTSKTNGKEKVKQNSNPKSKSSAKPIQGRRRR